MELDPWSLRVSPENFASHLEILGELGKPVSLPDFVASYQAGIVPGNSIVVTFDDGYVDNFVNALVLLRRYRVPATIFVSTGYVGAPFFWWEALEHIFLRPNNLPPKLELQFGERKVEWSLDRASTYTTEQYEADCIDCKWLGEPGSRVRLYHEVYDALWSLDHDRRLKQIDNIVAWAGMDPNSWRDSRPMTTEEIASLGEEQIITIGAHSVNHLPLDEKPAALQESEILESRQVLERIVAKSVSTFAYPHGKFSDTTAGILKAHEFCCACTTREAPVERTTDPMHLPRFTVRNWDGDTFREHLLEWIGNGHGPGSQP